MDTLLYYFAKAVEAIASLKNLDFQLLQNSSEDIFDIEITTKMFYQLPYNRRQEQFVCAEQIYLAVPDNDRYPRITIVIVITCNRNKTDNTVVEDFYRFLCEYFNERQRKRC